MPALDRARTTPIPAAGGPPGPPVLDDRPPAFANLLLSGPCNLRCPDCLGRRLGPPPRSTLDTFPLPGLDAFCRRLRAEDVREVSLTGRDTDPLLYRHLPALVQRLREQVPGVRLSLHTNGQLAWTRLAAVHLHDRVTVSVPSLDPATYAQMTGGGRLLDLAGLLAVCRIPLKVSVLVTRRNLSAVGATLDGLQALGVRRAVLRRALDEPLPASLLPGATPVGWFGRNPVYRLGTLEVTEWRFATTDLRCLNLHPDGRIDAEYLLTRPREGVAR